MKVFNCNDPAVALSKLHGCKQHFLQAVTRICKNRKIVKLNQVVRFSLSFVIYIDYESYIEMFPLSQASWDAKCKALLLPDGPGIEDLETRFEELRRLFPLAKKWLEWWGTADISSMLFPARKCQPLDDPPFPGEDIDEDEDDVIAPRRRPELPSTTNGQESMHRVYYMLWYVSI